MQVTYRPAQPEDHEGIFRVLRTANFHRIPSPEVPVFDLDLVIVAESAGRIVGIAGFTVLPDGNGKTTVMAVDPAWRRHGIGERLQGLRMEKAYGMGCRTLLTECDRPETVAWYERKFGYRRIGRQPKLHEFGDVTIDHWILIQCDIEAWIVSRAAGGEDAVSDG